MAQTVFCCFKLTDFLKDQKCKLFLKTNKIEQIEEKNCPEVD
jgi:hypothetical protein